MNAQKMPSPVKIFCFAFILSLAATTIDIKGGLALGMSGETPTLFDIIFQFLIGLIMGGICWGCLFFLSTIKPERLLYLGGGLLGVVLGAQCAQLFFVSFFNILQLFVFIGTFGYGYQHTVKAIRKGKSPIQ